MEDPSANPAPSGMRQRLLIVEDEPAQMEVLTYNLKSAGFEVIAVDNGEEAMTVILEELPDLILLDWMLPHLSGIEVCRQIKRHRDSRAIPVMMLTARGEEEDRVRGLDTGADDFMVKPYSIRELIARVKALLRRATIQSSDQPIEIGDISIDTLAHRVTRRGRDIELSPTEYRLLLSFSENPARVLSRENLLTNVWGRHNELETRTVDVHVGRLRKALSQEGAPDPIRTVRGFGYALSDAFLNPTK